MKRYIISGIRGSQFLLSVAISVGFISLSNIAFADSPNNWNVSTNPLGVVLGPNLQLEYKLDNHWTVGPVAGYSEIKLGSVGNEGWSGGVATTYHFNETFADGWFATLGATYGSSRIFAEDSFGNVDSAHVNNFSVQALGGYRWFWDHFNLSIGLGLATNSASDSNITDRNGNKVDSFPLSAVVVDGDLSIGWAF